MIKFFRKIRQNLLMENKTGKYFKYAIGEIILVVIGILIALQINTWNENRKKEVQEVHFLRGLAEDLVSDTIYFNSRIKISNTIINNHYQYIHLAYEEIKSTEGFQDLVKLLLWDSTHFVFQNSTYIELLNSGQLNIFKNSQLKADIITLYKDYEIAATHIKEYNEHSAAYLRKTELTHVRYWNYLSHIFDKPYMFKKTDWQFINNPSSYKFRILEETAATYSHKHQFIKDYYENLKKKTTFLINDIENELENRN
jgi:hypothetical protein